MAQQPNLFPPNSPDARQAGTSPESDVSARPIRWVRRIEAIIRILVRLYLGLLVLVLPWLPFWTQNNLFTYDPILLTLASSGFVRGVISGLGLLGIILAVLEAKNAPELS
jgi:formate-dependent nitrite reductase membrane component NrfD